MFTFKGIKTMGIFQTKLLIMFLLRYFENSYSPPFVKLIVISISLCSLINTAFSQEENFLTDKAGGKVIWYPNLNEPHAVHFDGKTYVAFHGGGQNYLDPMVVAYDHKTGKVSDPVKVDDNPLAEFNDSHGNPAIMVDDLGFIHVMYGGHGFYDGGRMTHAVSKRPNDISAWEILDNIDSTGTYPQLVKTDDGTLYYFYREENVEAGNHRGDWVYVVSTDHGRTFSEKISLLSGGQKRTTGEYADAVYYDAWYAAMYKGEKNSLHVLSHYHSCVNPFKDPLHAQRRFNLYHIMMKNHSGEWKNLSDKKLQLPLGLDEVDKHCMIFKSKNVKDGEAMERAFVANLTTDKEGNPLILMVIGKGKNGRNDRKAILMTGEKNTGLWSKKEVPKVGKLVWQRDGRMEIWSEQLYVSKDKGKTWEVEIDFRQKGMAGLSLVFDGTNEARVVAHDQSQDKENRKIYMWGTDGFIKKSN